jgi:hypothetical protein
VVAVAEACALRAAQAAGAVERIGHAAGRVAVVTAAIPQQARAVADAQALSPRFDAIAVFAGEVEQRADAEGRRALGEIPGLVNIVAREVDEQRRAGDGGAEPGAVQDITVVAGEIDDRRKAVHREVAAAVFVVAAGIDEHRHLAAARRRELVNVVAARADHDAHQARFVSLSPARPAG